METLKNDKQITAAFNEISKQLENPITRNAVIRDLNDFITELEKLEDNGEFEIGSGGYISEKVFQRPFQMVR